MASSDASLGEVAAAAAAMPPPPAHGSAADGQRSTPPPPPSEATPSEPTAPSPTAIPKRGAYQRGTPATCDTCGLTGHRTALCVTHLLPDLIIHTTSRRRARLSHYLTTSPLYAPFTPIAIPCPREPTLLYLQCSSPSLLLHTAQMDSVINRHFYQLYVSRDTTRHVERLLRVFAEVDGGERGVKVVRVQCYPKAVTEGVVRMLREGGVQVDPREFSHVLHVVFAYGRYHYALVGADHHYTSIHQRLDTNIHPNTTSPSPSPSPTPSSSSSLPPPITVNGASPSFDTVVCRAYYKLKETFHLEPSLVITPTTRAVDLGSAPGGWTSYLAAAGCERVVSIDPGELLIPPSPAVVHVQKRVQDSGGELAEHGPYSLCVCDMNCYSLQAIHAVLSLLPHLLPHAPLVLTIKELQAGQSKRLQAGAMDLLDCAFEGMRTHFLLANGKERTLVGWRRTWREGEGEEVRRVMERLEEEMRLEAEVIKGKAQRVSASGVRSRFGKKWMRHQHKTEMRMQQQQEEQQQREGSGTEGAEEEADVAADLLITSSLFPPSSPTLSPRPPSTSSTPPSLDEPPPAPVASPT